MAKRTVAGLHGIEDVVASRYRIHSLLGQGGTGSTYQAEDLKTHHWVALKVMSLKQLGNWDLLKRFEREAEALGKIDHPGVPDYIEHFQIETADDCRFYLVQEFAAGKSLDKWVANGWRATEAEVKRIAAAVLHTLAYLHALEPPMIHRDIKPQNIIRQPDGRIYLVDFGAVQSVCRDALQQRGTFVGTMGYMPPEQLRGRATLASDLYGLGATLVYLLTHRNPDELPMERMRIAFRGRVKLSDGFATWLEQMLEPMVTKRWESSEAALQALQALSLTKPSLSPKCSNVQVVKLHPKRDEIQDFRIEELGSEYPIYIGSKPRELRIEVNVPRRRILEICQNSFGIFLLLYHLVAIPLLSVVQWITNSTYLFIFLTAWPLVLIVCVIALIILGVCNGTYQAEQFRQLGYSWISISPQSYSIGSNGWNQNIHKKTGLSMEVSHFTVKSVSVPIRYTEKKTYHEVEKIYEERLFVVLASGELLPFAGHLPRKDSVQLAQRANELLAEHRQKFPPFEPSYPPRLNA